MRRLAAAPAHALAPLLLAVLGMLGGCDLLGIEGASVVAARHEAEGKAIGAACRHAGRAIEDCYVLNRKADKGAVFAGWREMNDYMRENKIDAVAPQLGAQTAAGVANTAGSRIAPTDRPAPQPAAKTEAKVETKIDAKPGATAHAS